MQIDQAKLEAFMGQVVTDMGGFVGVTLTHLGHRLGLWKAMAQTGPSSSADLAKRTGCNERLVREWLGHQVAGKYVFYDAKKDTYELPPEHAFALANEGSPVFVAEGVKVAFSMVHDLDKIERAFRGDGALAWGDHHQCLFSGTAEFFRPGYRGFLTSAWIPALEGVKEKLAKGARVADIGCGFGTSTCIMACAFPKSEFFGFDYHAPSIEAARREAKSLGIAERAKFATHGAKEYPAEGGYDLICFFDCLHDMGDPVGIAEYAKKQLAPGGTVMLVEPFAHDSLAENINPIGRLFYGASTCICTPNSLSQEGKLGLGAQAGEARTRKVFEQAGFKSFRRATETPFNLIYEARG